MDIFTLPDAAAMLAGITAYSASFFSEFLPMIYVPLAFTAVALLLLWIIHQVQRALMLLFHRGNKYE